jgi:hypothetical protein
MGPRITATVLLTAALAILPIHASAQERWTPMPVRYLVADTTSRAESAFGPLMEDGHRAIGIPPLRIAALIEGWSEIRLWTGFGLGTPNALVRLVFGAERSAGEVFLWWDAPPETLRERADSLGFYSSAEWTSIPEGSFMARRGCTASHAAGYAIACQVVLPRRVDWGGYVERLLAEGVFAVPDPDTLPGERLRILDGYHLMGETLQGARYRTWHWERGEIERWPDEGSRVAAIWELVEMIVAESNP